MMEIEKNYSDMKKKYPYKIIYTDNINVKMLFIDSTIQYYMSSFNENETPKISELKNSIYDFSNLQKNWDSYKANVISKESINISIQFIKFLESNNIIIDYAFPMSDGGIQLEIDLDNYSIEIEISPEKKIKLLIFNNKLKLILEKDYDIFNLNNLIESIKDYYGDIQN